MTSEPERTEAGQAVETCPSCGAQVPSFPGIRTWCECGWNVRTPRAEEEAKGVFARIYRELGRVHGDALFDAVCRDRSERPGPTWRTRAVLALSLLVVGGWLLFPAGAIAVVAYAPGEKWRWLLGAILAFAAWATGPRFPRMEDTTRLTRATHPELFGLVDEVAASVGVKPPDRIESWPALNAFAGRFGILQRRILVLRTPLVAAHAPGDLVALLGHEIGHFANGDTTRSIVVGAALRTLDSWERTLAVPAESTGNLGLYLTVSNAITRLLSLVPRGLLRVLAHLSWMESQRAEYCADRLSAVVAGSDAAIESFDPLLDGDLLGYACHQVVVAGSSRGAIAEFVHQRSVLHPRERARRRLAAALDPTPIDATHPPTGRRIAAMAALGRLPPRVTLDAARHAAILRELAPDIARADKRLRDRYEWSMYDGDDE